jgi:hypothetical protein
MRDQATRLWGWVRHHRVWSAIILIALVGGILWFGLYGTIYLVPFGLPPLPGQNCGSLQHGDAFFAQDEDGTVRADVTVKPLNCFWRAYQTCQAAMISQTLAGTDAGHTDTLTIELRGSRLPGMKPGKQMIASLRRTSTAWLIH